MVNKKRPNLPKEFISKIDIKYFKEQNHSISISRKDMHLDLFIDKKNLLYFLSDTYSNEKKEVRKIKNNKEVIIYKQETLIKYC